MSNETTDQRIKKNRRRVYDAESYVRFNSAQVLVGRSAIEENRTLALESFTAEASGNRALLSSTVDDVYRNRIMLVELLEPATPEEERFKTSMRNRVRIEELELLASVNRRALEINQKMVDVNKLLIEINVMATKYNEEVFEAINEVSTANAKWLDGELEQAMRGAAAGDNDARVTENTARVTELREAAENNRDVIKGIYERAAENRAHLEKDLEDVNDLRNEIVGLREKIAANQHRVADKISDL
ncbi:MAG: hypothetical protein ACO3V3_06335 [Burkholderiaceae bacterium]|jgi:Mg2+ and Co2+ transporter CorA